MKRGRDGGVFTIDSHALRNRMEEIYKECEELRTIYFNTLAEGKWIYRCNERFLRTSVHDKLSREADIYYQKILMDRVYLVPKEMVVVDDDI